MAYISVTLASCKSWQTRIDENVSIAKQTNAQDILGPTTDSYPGIVRLIMIGARDNQAMGTGAFINDRMDLILTAAHVVAHLCTESVNHRHPDCRSIFSAREFNDLFGTHSALSEDRIMIDWRYFELARNPIDGIVRRETHESRVLRDLKEVPYRATIFVHPSAGAYDLSHKWLINDQHDLALIQIHTAPGSIFDRSWLPHSIRRSRHLHPLVLHTDPLPEKSLFTLTLPGFGHSDTAAATGSGVKRVGRNNSARSTSGTISVVGVTHDNSPQNPNYNPRMPSKGEFAGNTSPGKGDSGGPGLILLDERTGEEAIAGVTCCGHTAGAVEHTTLSRIDTNLGFFVEAYRKGFHVPATCCQCKTGGALVEDSYDILVGKQDDEAACAAHSMTSQKTCRRIDASHCQYADPR